MIVRELRSSPQLPYLRNKIGRFTVLSLVFILVFAASAKDISVTTHDSTTIQQGTYCSIFFVAEPARAPGSTLPVEYQFTESGETPPGMKFETYPCNKPDIKVCPQLATANGIFLDGVPSAAGSYTVVITAVDLAKKGASRQFTIVVGPRR
jgi:hypothetical protein